jgi:hypothetical protein
MDEQKYSLYVENVLQEILCDFNNNLSPYFKNIKQRTETEFKKHEHLLEVNRKFLKQCPLPLNILNKKGWKSFRYNKLDQETLNEILKRIKKSKENNNIFEDFLGD